MISDDRLFHGLITRIAKSNFLQSRLHFGTQSLILCKLLVAFLFNSKKSSGGKVAYFNISKVLDKSKISRLFSRDGIEKYSNLWVSVRDLSAKILLVNLFWTLSTAKISFFKFGFQTTVAYSSTGLTYIRKACIRILGFRDKKLLIIKFDNILDFLTIILQYTEEVKFCEKVTPRSLTSLQTFSCWS